MSEAEDIIDRAIDEHLYLREFKQKQINAYNNKALYWTTKEGQRMLIQDMSTRHIKNCINFLLRKNSNHIMIEIFSIELENRDRIF